MGKGVRVLLGLFVYLWWGRKGFTRGYEGFLLWETG